MTGERATTWTLAAVLASAAYSFLVLALPIRGLTLFLADWESLYRLTHGSWPGCWFGSAMEHWVPAAWAFMDGEYRLFGTNNDSYTLVNWAIHVLNVFLVARLLHARTGDERIAAVTAAAFGLSAQHREMIWCGLSLGGWALCFTFSAAAFLGHERYRTHGSRLGLAVAAVGTFLAPAANGGGLALGPALMVEALLLAPRGRRARAVAAVALALAAYLAAYRWAMTVEGHPRLFPRNLAELGLAGSFALNFVGAGTLGGFFLGKPGSIPEQGPALAAVYAVLIGTVVAFVGSEARRRIVAAHVAFGLYVGMIALTRWSYPAAQATSSRYHYFPALCWTTGLALGLCAAQRRFPRHVLPLSLLTVLLLALGHARSAANDDFAYSPRARAQHPAILEHLVRAIENARGPVYDAPVPYPISEQTTGVCAVMALIAPTNTATFTNLRNKETTALYRNDPLLRAFVEPR